MAGRKRAQVDQDQPLEGGKGARAKKLSEKAKAAVTTVKAGDCVEAQAPPKKRGRPVGSKNKPKDTPAVVASHRSPVCASL